MCYRPINIVNSAKHLFAGSRFHISVPCGCCFQCQQQKSLEYEMRAYYEFVDCLKNGGFVYTDCLTYDDNHLPRLKDYLDYIPNEYNYPCFSYVDFRLFLVRLRKYLERKGYDVKDKLRYFMASEYGTSLTGTHRPHYHAIFYSNVPNLTNTELSLAVSRCWSAGRTDGLPFQTQTYINKHTYSGVVPDGDILKTIGYISKYVAKQAFYNKLVFKRFENIVRHFNYDEDSKECKQLKKDIKKYSFQFHRQSSGFGLSALGSSCNSVKEVAERGCFLYKSLKSSAIKVPIPTYFSRKLFYDVVKSIDGSLHWYLNDRGIQYKQDMIPKCIDSYALKLESIYENLDANQKQVFEHYLGSRSFRNFAEYILIYKGRLKSDEQMLREKKGIFYADNPYLFQSISLQPFLDSVFYNYNTSKTKSKYGKGFLSLIDIENTKFFPRYKHFPVQSPVNISAFIERYSNLYPRADIEKCLLNNIPFCFTNKSFDAYVVNEHSDPSFENFDTLFNFLAECLCAKGAPQQQAFNLKQYLTSIYKQFYAV